MDNYSTLDQCVALNGEISASNLVAPQASIEELCEFLRFPGDDGGRSLIELAGRDLDVTLQLLAERAQYITGASGAAIALQEGGKMVCRASVGASAPKIGVLLEVNSGLSGESVRTRQVLRCDDSQNDPRVDGASCLALRIVSIVVMPLLRQQQVVGVFELLSGRPRAFEERDMLALQRLGEMIQTAVDHAEAASRVQQAILPEPSAGGRPTEEGFDAEEEKQSISGAGPKNEARGLELLSSPGSTVERGNIGRCTNCGFPVSEGRPLCVDCETSHAPNRKLSADDNRGEAQDISADAAAGKDIWLPSNKYLIGTLMAAIAVMAVILWLR